MNARAKITVNKRKVLMPTEWRSDCPACKRPTRMTPYLGEYYCTRCRRGWMGS